MSRLRHFSTLLWHCYLRNAAIAVGALLAVLVLCLLILLALQGAVYVLMRYSWTQWVLVAMLGVVALYFAYHAARSALRGVANVREMWESTDPNRSAR